MSVDRRVEERNVTLDCSRHPLAVVFPAFGAPLNVGEEEGDGAAR
jgi:hypothetical protein